MRDAKRWALSIAVLGFGMAVCLPADAQIYRWTDEDGRLHFTEQLEKVPLEYRAQVRRNMRASRNARGVQTFENGGKGAAPASHASTARRVLPRTVTRGGEIEIPFQRNGSLMRVEATLNDLVRVPFLIDTGASGVSIPSIYAEKLGIRIRSDTDFVQVHTANGVVARALVPVQSVQVGGARVEHLTATVNPSMRIGLLGGDFFNNFVYRVDAARGVMTLVPNPNIRGGLGPDQWRRRFETVNDPLRRIALYLSTRRDLRQDERAPLLARRKELEAELARLEREADRLDVPQIWRE
ncbi:MAG: aspartyl protease family protein [Myxococcota bacterium]